MGNHNSRDIYINLIHYPLSTLGPGNRVGIWFQGCNIRCSGCMSEFTWEQSAVHKTTTSVVMAALSKYQGSGITISGGEPFFQPDALYELLLLIRERGFNDILLYSGYRHEELALKYGYILPLVDVLIDGEFTAGMETQQWWKGSENQRAIVLSKQQSLVAVYEKYLSQRGNMRPLQVIKLKDRIFIAGIPRQQDMEAILNGIG
ncbi:MAG: radical SAM protein [Nitrospirae bacterium YQR-1]